MQELEKKSEGSFLYRVSQIFAIDLRSLALFRIGLALVLLSDLYQRALDLEFFYSDQGALPRADAMRFASPGMFSLHLANGTWQFQALLFSIAAAAQLALLLGYRTRIASVLSWLLLVSLNRRNLQVLQGGDDLIRSLSFWAMFLPLGARWSIDTVNAKYPRARKQVKSIASAVILLQVLLVYLFTAILKTGAPWRKEGTAITYALLLDQFTKPLGYFLLEYRQLLPFLTFAVMALETYGPLLILIPFHNSVFRMITVVLFVCFHLGLMLSMELGPFPYICIAGWMLFIPSAVWDRILPLASERAEPDPPPVKQDTPWILRAVAGAVLLFCFANVLCWNIRTTAFQRWEKVYPVRYNFINQVVGLDQYWAMFAPFPLTIDGWYIMTGKTHSGRTVNLMPRAHPDDPITDDKPVPVAATFPTERWRKYLMNMAMKENELWRPPFAAALERKWNAAHPEDPVKVIEIFYWYEYSKLAGSEPREKKLLMHYEAPIRSKPAEAPPQRVNPP